MLSNDLASRLLRAGVFLSLGVAALAAPAGCGSRHQDRDPAEQIGHDIDHAADDVSESVDEAGEEIDESVHGD